MEKTEDSTCVTCLAQPMLAVGVMALYMGSPGHGWSCADRLGWWHQQSLTQALSHPGYR
ncbi:hypothetical protein IAI38_11635, partial [Streptococcus pseudopneumoniae]|nr:hypothetical protein [Streptococcus pseudopneumoniae]